MSEQQPSQQDTAPSSGDILDLEPFRDPETGEEVYASPDDADGLELAPEAGASPTTASPEPAAEPGAAPGDDSGLTQYYVRARSRPNQPGSTSTGGGTAQPPQGQPAGSAAQVRRRATGKEQAGGVPQPAAGGQGGRGNGGQQPQPSAWEAGNGNGSERAETMAEQRAAALLATLARKIHENGGRANPRKLRSDLQLPDRTPEYMHSLGGDDGHEREREVAREDARERFMWSTVQELVRRGIITAHPNSGIDGQLLLDSGSDSEVARAYFNSGFVLVETPGVTKAASGQPSWGACLKYIRESRPSQAYLDKFLPLARADVVEIGEHGVVERPHIVEESKRAKPLTLYDVGQKMYAAVVKQTERTIPGTNMGWMKTRRAVVNATKPVPVVSRVLRSTGAKSPEVIGVEMADLLKAALEQSAARPGRGGDYRAELRRRLAEFSDDAIGRLESSTDRADHMRAGALRKLVGNNGYERFASSILRAMTIPNGDPGAIDWTRKALVTAMEELNVSRRDKVANLAAGVLFTIGNLLGTPYTNAAKRPASRPQPHTAAPPPTYRPDRPLF